MMVSVNLMPWRQRRLQQRWRTWRLLTGVMVTLLMSGMLAGQGQQRLNQHRMALLGIWPEVRQNVAALRSRTLEAQKRLAQLQQQRQRRWQQKQGLVRWNSFIQRLDTDMPTAIWLNSLKKNQQNVVLKGGSHNVADLHHLRDMLRQQPEIKSVTLGALRRESSGNISFNMQLTLLGLKESHE